MKNIKSLICIALAGATLSSCKDFLTLVLLGKRLTPTSTIAMEKHPPLLLAFPFPRKGHQAS